MEKTRYIPSNDASRPAFLRSTDRAEASLQTSLYALRSVSAPCLETRGARRRAVRLAQSNANTMLGLLKALTPPLAHGLEANERLLPHQEDLLSEGLLALQDFIHSTPASPLRTGKIAHCVMPGRELLSILLLCAQFSSFQKTTSLPSSSPSSWRRESTRTVSTHSSARSI